MSLHGRAVLLAVVAALALACGETNWTICRFANRATAQVVQLPSVHSFSYSGGASVPDHGDAYLGGYRSRRASSSTTGAGPLAGRSRSSQIGAGSLTVSAEIIDLQAMDEAILNQAADQAATAAANYAARPTGTPIMNTLTPHLYSQRTMRDPVPATDPNAWQIALGTPPPRAETGRVVARDDSAARYYMLKAKEAAAVGRNAAARVYYQMAYEQLTPAQRTRLQDIQRRANEAARQNMVPSETGAAAIGSAATGAAATGAAATGAAAIGSTAGDSSGRVQPATGEAETNEPATAGAGGGAQAETSEADPFATPF